MIQLLARTGGSIRRLLARRKAVGGAGVARQSEYELILLAENGIGIVGFDSHWQAIQAGSELLDQLPGLHVEIAIGPVGAEGRYGLIPHEVR